MIKIINKVEGDACSQVVMCFRHLTDNTTLGMAAIWMSGSVTEPRPNHNTSPDPIIPLLLSLTLHILVSIINMHSSTQSIIDYFLTFDVAFKITIPSTQVQHNALSDSPGRLTIIHPSSSASVTHGLGPFSSAATSSTSPNSRLLRR